MSHLEKRLQPNPLPPGDGGRPRWGQRRLLLSSALMLSACAGSAPATQDGPAVITNASSGTHEEIRGVISAALHGAPVTISNEALTRESFVTIERNQFRDERGLLLNGRDPGRPERFELLRSAGQCVLVHERTGVRTVLKSAQCTHSAAASTTG